MSDIFISYAREDLGRIRHLAQALESKGWSVFWDRRIPPGKTWHDVIEGELATTRVVVVAWSAAANRSEWVRDEASEGRARGILVPVLLEGLKPPLGFRAIQAADLVDWSGDTATEGFHELIGTIGAIVDSQRSSVCASTNPAKEQDAAAAQAAEAVRLTQNGGVELVLIPGDAFLMGSPASERDREDCEGRQHKVTVEPFYLGRYPVTNEEYARFMQANADAKERAYRAERKFNKALGRHPVTNEEYARFMQDNADAKEPEYWADRKFNQALQPVVGVSWEDAQRFAQWAGARLATEAEWEYAARAGTTTRYWWGDEVGENNANCAGCGSQWDGKQPSPVGSFQPNAFGVHDMLGNVWEWVQDCWHESYKGAPMDGSAWGEKPGGDCALRVIRGGSWLNGPGVVRSACRDGGAPGYRNHGLGFRLAQDN